MSKPTKEDVRRWTDRRWSHEESRTKKREPDRKQIRRELGWEMIPKEKKRNK